ncbi:uncharacterized protein [Euwallacea similis]|uniref:uncharacterized protein n=1 Tax=Euwallacea similis TaxID=1736056 RepID=UPI00344CE071
MMCDQPFAGNKPLDDFMDIGNFKSNYARSIVVNTHFKHSKNKQVPEKIVQEKPAEKTEFSNFESLTLNTVQKQDHPVKYRKNIRSASMDDSRRYSCGSILSRRNSLFATPRRGEIPVENIYNQNKIETLQWQLRKIEKSRGMYKAVMEQIVVFLGKTHTSLEHLGNRLNRKSSVTKSKSEYHIERDSTVIDQRALVEEHLSSWTPNKKADLHPDEIPPEKLSQEAFRLLRTAQSLLHMQEPNLTSSQDSVKIPEEPSDIEFLAQLAKEFPSDGQRPASFSVSPKLILPENDIKISTAFNRKLSLQLGDSRRNSKYDVARASITETECYSLPLGGSQQADPLRPLDGLVEHRGKNVEKAPGFPATASISSTEDESGFSSMNSFEDVGLPLVNSTAMDEVSARSVLLKSMLHNNSDYGSLISNDSMVDTTLTLGSPGTNRRSIRMYDYTKERKLKDVNSFSEENVGKYCSSDVTLWQKPADTQIDVRKEFTGNNMAMNCEFGTLLAADVKQTKRRSLTSNEKTNTPNLKVLWV